MSCSVFPLSPKRELSLREVKLIAHGHTPKILLSRKLEPSCSIFNPMFFSLCQLLYSLKGAERHWCYVLSKFTYKLYNSVKIHNSVKAIPFHQDGNPNTLGFFKIIFLS